VVKVTFKEFEPYSGYDDTETPHYIMVPKNGINKAIVEIEPSSAASKISFVSANTDMAVVSPPTASSSSQTITIDGIVVGSTEIRAVNIDSGAVFATLGVDVKNRLDKTIAIHVITDEINGLVPVASVNYPSSLGNLTTYLNTVWGKQANIFFTATRCYHTVNYDRNNNGMLDDPLQDSNKKPKDPPYPIEIDAILIVCMPDPCYANADFHYFCVSSYEVPIGYQTTVENHKPWVFTQGTDNKGFYSVENHMAHEAGHCLGRQNDSDNPEHVMYSHPTIPGIRLRVPKKDWDNVNPNPKPQNP
jgi:hypothetical protein